MMKYVVFILSAVFVVGFVGFSSKPSPIYGGLGLILSGGAGCGVVINYGGSFLGLIVFLVYLGGMLVVFGYTTAMAMEQFPEAWVSNKVVLGSFVMGLVMEGGLVIGVLKGGEVDLVYGFDGLGDWAVSGLGDSMVFSEEGTGVGALYVYGVWLVLFTGWSLLMGVVVIMEVTRGK